MCTRRRSRLRRRTAHTPALAPRRMERMRARHPSAVHARRALPQPAALVRPCACCIADAGPLSIGLQHVSEPGACHQWGAHVSVHLMEAHSVQSCLEHQTISKGLQHAPEENVCQCAGGHRQTGEQQWQGGSMNGMALSDLTAACSAAERPRGRICYTLLVKHAVMCSACVPSFTHGQ